MKARERGDPIGQLCRQPDVELDIERFRDFFGHEHGKTATRGIDPPQELVLVPAQAEAVIAVPRPRLPGRRLGRAIPSAIASRSATRAASIRSSGAHRPAR